MKSEWMDGLLDRWSYTFKTMNFQQCKADINDQYRKYKSFITYMVGALVGTLIDTYLGAFFHQTVFD